MEQMRLWVRYGSICARRAAATVAVAFLVAAAPAGADLRIHPKRVVFEGRTRTASVTLVNNDPETYTYRITWQMLRMNAAGRLERIEDVEGGAEVAEANAMLRYAPRQVTVAPGVAQTVRIMLRKPADLVDGEYRAHMLFLREPRNMRMGSEEDGLEISLNVLYGISIPIFVRQGELEVDVAIEQVVAERDGDTVNLDIHLTRTGSRSVYGDVDVFYQRGGKDLMLSTVRGIGIYTETDTRRVPMQLTMPDGTPVPPGRLLVRYRAPKEQDNALLAEATVTIN